MNIPAHVPKDLVRDYDYYDLEGDPDLYLHFKKKLHSGGPDVFYTPRNGGHWVVTRFDDMEYIYTHPEEFSSRHQVIPAPTQTFGFVEYDGQKHADFRALIQPFFTPKKIGELEPVARKITVSLIEEFYAKGECEFTSEFALKLPTIIVMGMLVELPEEDTPYLLQCAEDIARCGGDPEKMKAAFDRAFAYFGQIIPVRKANPGKDMLSAIIHGKVEGGRSLTDEETLGMCAVLMAGGLDTVASTLGMVAMFLARNPAHRQRLIDDPSQIPNALEELMRRHHIINTARTVAKDMQFKNVQFKAGEMVLLPNTVAGLDETHFPNPLEVDFDRADKKHMVFGRGPHQCIGSYVARTELRVFLQEWLKRIPEFSIKAGETPVMEVGIANRVAYLPLTWPVK